MLDVQLPEPHIFDVDYFVSPDRKIDPFSSHYHGPPKAPSRAPSIPNLHQEKDGALSIKKSFSTASIVKAPIAQTPSQGPQTIPTPAQPKLATVLAALNKLAKQDGAQERIFKVVQYFIKLFTQIGHLALLKPLWLSMGIESVLGPLAGQISTFRKINKMALWYSAAQKLQSQWQAKEKELDFTAPQKSQLHSLYKYSLVLQKVDSQMLSTTLRVWNCLWDDINTSAKLLSSLKYSSSVVRYSFIRCSRAWMAGILLSFYLESRAYLSTTDETKQAEIKLTLRKLGADFVFCLIDCFEYPTHELVQTSLGLVSGSIALYKAVVF